MRINLSRFAAIFVLATCIQDAMGASDRIKRQTTSGGSDAELNNTRDKVSYENTYFVT